MVRNNDSTQTWIISNQKTFDPRVNYPFKCLFSPFPPCLPAADLKAIAKILCSLSHSSAFKSAAICREEVAVDSLAAGRRVGKACRSSGP